MVLGILGEEESWSVDWRQQRTKTVLTASMLLDTAQIVSQH